jgi:glycosyltransferase involved in cell wall biosynthesis
VSQSSTRSTPAHVAVVVNDLKPYGSQRVALALAGTIAELGLATELITLEATDADALTVPAGVERVSIVRSHGGPLGYAGLLLKMSRLLARRRPQAILSHMVMANVVSVGAAALVPGYLPAIVVTEHSPPTRNLSVERSPRALGALARALYPNARAVVGVSGAVAADATDTYRLDPAHVRAIFNPVDVAGVRQAATGTEPPHRWLGPGEAARTVVCVGGLRWPKGQDILIRALAQAPDVRAILLGEGSDAAKLSALAVSLGVEQRVAFAGYRADAVAFIAHAAALVIPSRWEGFGLVAVEAAALGVPVVGCTVGGLPELVPAHVPGTLVASEDPGALAEAISRTLREGGGGEADLDAFEPRAVALCYLQAAGLNPPFDT